MKQQVGLLAALLLLAFGQAPLNECRSFNVVPTLEAGESEASVGETTATTTTTAQPTAGYMDNPQNSELAATSGEDDNSNCAWQCYKQVEKVKKSISELSKLQRKHKQFISSNSKVMKEPLRTTRNATSTSRTVRSGGQDHVVVGGGSSNSNNKLVVVSTLRVARAADLRHASVQEHRNQVIKRNKQKQKHQSLLTCKALEELEICLHGISEDCIGDLQYHSHEVYFRDSWEKFSCKYNSTRAKNPDKKLLKLATGDDIQEDKVPAARPLSTPDEIAKRIAALFKDSGNVNPFGVMLKPTSSKLLSKQQLSDPNNPMEGANQNTIGYLTQHKTESDRSRLKEVIGGASGGPRIFDNDDPLVIISSQLLVATCFLVLMIVVVGLTGHYIKKTRLEP